MSGDVTVLLDRLNLIKDVDPDFRQILNDCAGELKSLSTYLDTYVRKYLILIEENNELRTKIKLLESSD